MKKLKHAGLFNNDLIWVNSPLLVNRYNECLQAIGTSPTKLNEFHIDGVGWSPEIAQEKEDVEYLGQTASNPYAIIITVEQESASVYIPFHSFDENMMSSIWNMVGSHIAQLTTYTGLWVDLDQGLSTYRSPDDLQMLDGFTVKIHSVGNFMTGARQQRELVSLLSVGNNWMSTDLHEKIRASGQAHGDVRFQNVVIPEIPFTNVRSFYARAFGGVFIFRDVLKNSQVIMIVRDPVFFDEDRGGVLCLNDPERVLDRMIKEDLFDCFIEAKRIPKLCELKDTLFAETAFAHDPDFDILSSTSGERKAFVSEHLDLFPDYYFELEILIKKLEQEQIIKEKSISKDLRRLIYRPSFRPSENQSLYELLMFLLVELITVPVHILFTYNKQLFYERYKSWPENKQRWAIDRILTHKNKHQTQTAEHV
jgi:hypothetical protein